MISGTSALLPYVCYYDTIEDILNCRTRMKKRAKGNKTKIIVCTDFLFYVHICYVPFALFVSKGVVGGKYMLSSKAALSRFLACTKHHLVLSPVTY